MLIIDAHLDLAWNALQWERDLRLSAHTIRVQEAASEGPGRGKGTVALPELRRGRVALCFATLLARSTGQVTRGIDYHSVAQAYAVAQGHIAYYEALAQDDQVRIIADRSVLDRHMLDWADWDASATARLAEAPPLGIVISMEGADPIMHPEQLPHWWQAGLRVIGLAHFGPGRYAGGTGTELGLTALGAELLDAMQQQGFILDLTHLSDQAFWAALERFSGPILASHCNARALVPHQRQCSDEQLCALIERGGVIGSVLSTWMLALEAPPNAPLGLAKVVDQIDHVCQLAGNSQHAAIGSDLDGGFGREYSPCDLDTVADLQRIGALLAERGYQPEDIANIMHGNWLRLLRQAWSA
jgi:membrane dipeptidase